MKIAVYARVSTLGKGQDVDMQLIDMRKSIESKGWDLSKEYVDRGVSGSKSSRPQLDKLMKDAADKKFDAVLVWKLDRFGRSVRHLVNAIAELESFGIAFISLKDSIDLTTAQGRLMFQIIAAMAEFERELIRERVKAGMQNARTKGKQIGRPSLGIDRGQVAVLKAAGQSWNEVSAALFCSVATAKRAYGPRVDSIEL